MILNTMKENRVGSFDYGMKVSFEPKIIEPPKDLNEEIVKNVSVKRKDQQSFIDPSSDSDEGFMVGKNETLV